MWIIYSMSPQKKLENFEVICILTRPSNYSFSSIMLQARDGYNIQTNCKQNPSLKSNSVSIVQPEA